MRLSITDSVLLKTGDRTYRLGSTWLVAIVSAFLLFLVAATGVMVFGFGSSAERNWVCPDGERFSEDCILAMSQDVGLDTEEMQACLREGRFTADIQEFQKQGNSFGIAEIPAVYFATGDENLTGFLVPGGLSAEQLSKLSNEEISTFEELQEFILGSLTRELTDLEKDLLQYYTSESGGSLSAEDARIKVREITEPDREKLKQAALLRSYEITRGPFVGNGDITVIVFSNYECARCRELMQKQLPIFEYGARNGAFRYVFRDVVIEPYANSEYLANAAYCAGEQGRFFDFHARLFQ